MYGTRVTIHVYTCKILFRYLSILLKFVVYVHVLKYVAIKLHSTIGNIVRVIKYITEVTPRYYGAKELLYYLCTSINY